MSEILTKSHNYRLWQSGMLGCKLRAWRSVDEWYESGFAGSVVLRLVEGRGPCRYNLSREDVPGVVDEWLLTGISLSQIMVNEAAPDNDVILQGEYLNDVFTLENGNPQRVCSALGTSSPPAIPELRSASAPTTYPATPELHSASAPTTHPATPELRSASRDGTHRAELGGSPRENSACWSYFHYSRAKRQMRDALKEAPETAVNLRADLLLRLAMTPASYEDWQELLGRYPGHVLEVSVYDRCLGDVPGRNALVWEVRRY